MTSHAMLCFGLGFCFFITTTSLRESEVVDMNGINQFSPELGDFEAINFSIILAQYSVNSLSIRSINTHPAAARSGLLALTDQ